MPSFHNFRPVFHHFGVYKLVVSWYRMCAVAWRHLVNATKVTAGLAESMTGYGRVDGLNVACGLTACRPGSATGPTLGNEYGENFTFFIFF